MSWYYIGPTGATNGPVSTYKLKQLYGNEIKDSTFIWNGTTIANWTQLNKIAILFKQVKPSPIPATSVSSTHQTGFPKRRRRRRRTAMPKLNTIPNKKRSNSHEKQIDQLKQKVAHYERKNNEWKAKEAGYKQKINELTQQLSSLQMEYDALHKANEREIITINQCEQQITELKQQTHQMREYETKYNELEQKYNQQIKNTEDYLSWNYQHIADWIVNINRKQYSKYYETLTHGMKMEDIDGSCLQDLNKNDLHRLGVSSFKDKRDIYNAIQDLVQKIRRNNEIVNMKAWMHKNIIKWTTDDVLQWIISLGLPNKLYYKIAFEIEENIECSGEDINSLLSSKEVGEAFGIKNQNICNKIFGEIKKIQDLWKSDINSCEDEKDFKEMEVEKNGVFAVYIYSQDKTMELNEKVTKYVTIEAIKYMYKEQSCVEANIDDIHLYAKSKLLPPNCTLEEVNIIDDKNLITVKFEADGADMILMNPPAVPANAGPPPIPRIDGPPPVPLGSNGGPPPVPLVPPAVPQ